MSLHRRVRTTGVLCTFLILLAPVAAGPPANPRRTPVVEAVERVRAAVVNIHSERTAQGAVPEEIWAHAPSQNRINGMGTGILIDPRGYIVTNFHVIDEVNLIRVRLSDGSTYSAQVLTRDHESDLAVLKIEAGHPLPTIPLGTSSDLMVGETVIAIGNAYGYEHTVTVGVVSALKRDVTLNKEVSYKQLIQTDASINPGNSGGPLININGELIGVNVAIRAGAQGIGFAIPVDSMLRVAADMFNANARKHNGVWHGLIGQDVVELVDAKNDGPTLAAGSKDGPAPTFRRRLLVDRVDPGSPAARSGLQPGDCVVQVGDVRSACMLDLERALLEHSPGDSVPVIVQRKGTEQKLQLVLQEAEKAASPSGDVVWRRLGVRLGPINPEIVTRANRQLHGGLVILEVSPASAAARAGIQRGDILVGLHQWETVSPENVVFVLSHPDLASFSPLRFFILRGGQIHKGTLAVEE